MTHTEFADWSAAIRAEERARADRGQQCPECFGTRITAAPDKALGHVRCQDCGCTWHMKHHVR